MSRSWRKPFAKIKLHWFQRYYNRKERRKAKRLIRSGKYDQAGFRLTRRGNYDVIDYKYNPYQNPSRENLHEKLSRK